MAVKPLALLIISPSLGPRLAHHVRSDRRVEGARLSNRPQHSALASVRKSALPSRCRAFRRKSLHRPFADPLLALRKPVFCWVHGLRPGSL